MNKWIRIILAVAVVCAITGGIIAYRIFNKPHRDVNQETGVQLTARQLFDAFKANEQQANNKYLDKAIQLTGEIADISKNQEGNIVVNFKTGDPLVMINCTFKTDPGNLKAGQNITFKGICTGYIPDANVVINEGVLVK
jgi:flagellar basal body-associated protein FliL